MGKRWCYWGGDKLGARIVLSGVSRSSAVTTRKASSGPGGWGCSWRCPNRCAIFNVAVVVGVQVER